MDIIVYVPEDHFKIFVFEDWLCSVPQVCVSCEAYSPYPSLFFPVGGFLEISGESWPSVDKKQLGTPEHKGKS